jgi:hypothetical protein
LYRETERGFEHIYNQSQELPEAESESIETAAIDVQNVTRNEIGCRGSAKLAWRTKKLLFRS